MPLHHRYSLSPRMLLLWLATVAITMGTLTLAFGCRGIPVLGPDGEPTGETRQVFDPHVTADAIEEGAETAAKFIPPPFNIFLPPVAGLIGLVLRNGRKDEQ